MKKSQIILITLVLYLSIATNYAQNDIPSYEEISLNSNYTISVLNKTDTVYIIPSEIKDIIVYMEIKLKLNSFRNYDTVFDTTYMFKDVPHIRYKASPQFKWKLYRESWSEVDLIEDHKFDIDFIFGENKTYSLEKMLKKYGKDPIYEGNTMKCKFKVPKKLAKYGRMKIRTYSQIRDQVLLDEGCISDMIGNGSYRIIRMDPPTTPHNSNDRGYWGKSDGVDQYYELVPVDPRAYGKRIMDEYCEKYKTHKVRKQLIVRPFCEINIFYKTTD